MHDWTNCIYLLAAGVAEKYKELSIQLLRNHGLFLSDIMQDGDSMHETLHHSSPALQRHILSAFYNYYLDHDRAKLKKLIAEPRDSNERHYFTLVENRLLDNSNSAETNWLKLELYDAKQDAEIQDMSNVYGFKDNSNYTNVSVAEILKDCLEALKQQKMLFEPLFQHIYDKDLRAALEQLQAGNNDRLASAMQMTNRQIASSFETGDSFAALVHVNGIILLEDKSLNYLRNMKYSQQFGFFKSELCAEMLKLSYMTSFQQGAPSAADLEEFLSKVQNAGSWQSAGRIISNYISNRTKKLTGINYWLLDISGVPRPNDAGCKAADKYLRRDNENIANYLYTGLFERKK